mmetsp:Transcript_19957/g.40885  ORF Transcript_19957/g.40885 Transcript_19957/m.40885 type:complete len:203 (-) Transcript_19957:427-1035(-)
MRDVGIAIDRIGHGVMDIVGGFPPGDGDAVEEGDEGGEVGYGDVVAGVGAGGHVADVVANEGELLPEEAEEGGSNEGDGDGERVVIRIGVGIIRLFVMKEEEECREKDGEHPDKFLDVKERRHAEITQLVKGLAQFSEIPYQFRKGIIIVPVIHRANDKTSDLFLQNPIVVKGPNFVSGIHAGKAEEGLLAAGMRGDPFGHI